MREILFRGKRQRIEDWVEGSLIVYPDGDCYIARPSDNPCVLDKFNIDPATVGQFTGLTDKNGKKIFEGDICQIKNDRLISDTPFVVDWEDFVYNGWIWRDLDEDGAIDSFTKGAARKCEVIGNIHDNPELLEVERG